MPHCSRVPRDQWARNRISAARQRVIGSTRCRANRLPRSGARIVTLSETHNVGIEGLSVVTASMGATFWRAPTRSPEGGPDISADGFGVLLGQRRGPSARARIGWAETHRGPASTRVPAFNTKVFHDGPAAGHQRAASGTASQRIVERPGGSSAGAAEYRSLFDPAVLRLRVPGPDPGGRCTRGSRPRRLPLRRAGSSRLCFQDEVVRRKHGPRWRRNPGADPVDGQAGSGRRHHVAWATS